MFFDRVQVIFERCPDARVRMSAHGDLILFALVSGPSSAAAEAEGVVEDEAEAEEAKEMRDPMREEDEAEEEDLAREGKLSE